MGFTDWLSGLFKPKEVKLALREGAAEIRRAEEDARKNVLPKAEMKQMARESDKAAEDAAKELKRLEIEGRKEREMLNKLPSKMTPEDLEAYFMGKGHKMTSDALAHIEGDFKKMHPDYFEKVAENLSKVFGEMRTLSQRSEKLAVIIAQQFAEQQRDFDSLIKNNAEREETVKRLKEIAHGKKFVVPTPQVLKLEADIMMKLADIDRRLVAAFNKVLERARPGSYFRTNMDEHLKVLARLSSYAAEVPGRVRYEMLETEKILAMQKGMMPLLELALQTGNIEASGVAVAANILKHRAA